MQSYDNPLTISYNVFFDYGGGAAEALAIKRPLGTTRCRIDEIHVMAAEVFTTGASVEIGTVADPDRFAELLIGTLADTDGLGISDPATQLFDRGYGGRGIVDMTTEGITQLEVLLTQSGGTPTGQGYTTIVISWW